MWGLPLRFYFVGFWLGVHRVRDPAVHSAHGSVGGSTKAQLGPVSSLSRLQKELLAVGQPPCACPPRAPGRQSGGGEAGDEQLSACGPPEPPTQGGQRLLQRQVTIGTICRSPQRSPNSRATLSSSSSTILQQHLAHWPPSTNGKFWFASHLCGCSLSAAHVP